MRFCLAIFLLLGLVSGIRTRGQEGVSSEKTQTATSEPEYDDTFSGSVVELSAAKIVVSRSILGKPAEKRTFWIKADTRIEGKLRVRAKVTVGFVTNDDNDIARLIVVRTGQRSSQDKK